MDKISWKASPRRQKLDKPQASRFKPRIEVQRRRRLCRVEIDLWPKEYDVSEEGVEELGKYLARYLVEKKITKRVFTVGPTYIAFYALKEDLEDVLREVLEIVTRNLKPLPYGKHLKQDALEAT